MFSRTISACRHILIKCDATVTVEHARTRSYDLTTRGGLISMTHERLAQFGTSPTHRLGKFNNDKNLN
jgi:hypothetical protein